MRNKDATLPSRLRLQAKSFSPVRDAQRLVRNTKGVGLPPIANAGMRVA